MKFQFRELYSHHRTSDLLLQTDHDLCFNTIAIVALDDEIATARILDVRSGEIKALEEANVNACCLSSDGSRCVMGGQEPFFLVQQGDRFQRHSLDTIIGDMGINFYHFVSDDRQFILVGNDLDRSTTPVVLVDCIEGVQERNRLSVPEGLVGMQVVEIDGQPTLSLWCEDYPSSHWYLLNLTDGTLRSPDLESPSEPWILAGGELVILDARCCGQDVRIVNWQTNATETRLGTNEHCRSHIQVSQSGNTILQQNISCLDFRAKQTLTSYTLDTYQRLGEASLATTNACLCCGSKAVAVEQPVNGEWSVVIYSIDFTEVLGHFPLPIGNYHVTCPADGSTLLLVSEGFKSYPASVAVLELEI
ncbi:hypothetical protein [Blastopirellula marina]|uniref:Uncharacterized protein n=1 Tax=Blastopirellula marina TaxID=124 RepID=A0A2S8G8Y4_9BACT|nr:hypothetical protein [Blastopirellula marina]PQO40731.1 hypothetical protein C5Y98_05810 [Blastopirellula marina]PTL45691.1 hypothetical protein C5Y97_05810 [Blastopirellula marina]